MEKHKWLPGKSGNPKGRTPNKECLTSLLRAEIEKMCPQDKKGRTWKELIVLSTMTLAIKGHPGALKEVWERMEGKVTQPITGADGGPIELIYNGIDMTHFPKPPKKGTS